MVRVRDTEVHEVLAGSARRRRRRMRMRSLFRISHARGTIPNEMGPARCNAGFNESAEDEEEEGS